MVIDPLSASIQMHSDEIDYVAQLISNMNSTGLFVEWGSGASTVHWANALQHQQTMISIEHDILWWRKVSDHLKNYPELSNKIKYVLSPNKHGYVHKYGLIAEEHPYGLDEYMFPITEIFNGDIFFIDGIGRATIAILLKFMANKSDSIIMIHDYYGREHWYSWATQHFSKIEKVGKTLARLYR